jgi:hypothetical protein
MNGGENGNSEEHRRRTARAMNSYKKNSGACKHKKHVPLAGQTTQN